MRRWIPAALLAALTVLVLAVSGCGRKTMEFTGTVEQVGDSQVLVRTIDFDAFDLANILITKDTQPVSFHLLVGQKIRVTALPEIRETYPVGVTAVRIELEEQSQSQPETQSDAPQAEQITPEQAKAVMDGEEPYLLLDVRTQEEYDQGHISGAILLPDDEITDRAAQELPDKDALILLYCRSGRRSAQAAAELARLGYTQVRDFGGIIDWPYEVTPA